jgi:hypothetical protein
MSDLSKEEKKEIKKEVKQVLEEEDNNKAPDMDYIPDDRSLDEKISDWFNKITLLGLDDEAKEEVATTVSRDSAGDKLYWIEIGLSSIIATL